VKEDKMTDKKPLWQEIQKFSGQKWYIALILLLLGLFGLVLPVIPGVLLIALAVFLIKPGWYEKLKKRFNME
jgi:uncharacterized protein YqgC (DUF456 family)